MPHSIFISRGSNYGKILVNSYQWLSFRHYRTIFDNSDENLITLYQCPAKLGSIRNTGATVMMLSDILTTYGSNRTFAFLMLLPPSVLAVHTFTISNMILFSYGLNH